jgi:Flp pilus assembly protein TadD
MTALLAGQPAWADDHAANFEMSFVASQAHGDLIAEGRYRLAIHLLGGNGHNPVAAMTNLCVAHTMIGQYVDARRACNRAVELSAEAALTAPESAHDEPFKNWVVALSNRGVLRAIRHQAGAEEDFRQAVALDHYSDTAARNLARYRDEDFERMAAR